MARSTMTKEVTFTTVSLAKMEMEDGQPIAVPLEDEVMIGNVSLEKANKEMKKKHDETVTVYGVQPNTEKYKMKVEDFIKLADKVEESEESEQE